MNQPISLAERMVRIAADVAEPVTASLILRKKFGRSISLGTVREVLGFCVIGGFLGPAAGTAVTMVGLAAFTTMPLPSVVSFSIVWGGGAVLGVVLFAPVLLTWRRPVHFPRGTRLLEAALLGLSMLGLMGLSRILPSPALISITIGFATFPLLAWAAVRFGPTGAARAAATLSLLSVWRRMLTETEPYPGIVALQGIYGLGAVMALLLAALTLETHRQRASAQAHAIRAEESLALLESALRSAPFAIAFFDRNLRLTRTNEVFAELAGRPIVNLLGRRPEEILPDIAPRLVPLLRRASMGTESASADVGLGGEAPTSWLCTAFPVSAGASRPLGAGLLMIDITLRRAAEQERTRLYKEAQEAVRVREDFLSIASHELKTPLTPLAARLSHIQKRLAGGGTVGPETIDKPLRSLQKLTDLINDLLDASRIEHGRLMLHREPLPLDDVVRLSVEPYLGSSPQHRVELKLPPEPLWVFADRQRLAQVVTNLVDNAIKYSPSGGTVCIQLRPHPEGIELTVSDEGIGIPEAQQRRLFERFYRASNASTSFGGLGLGLYITRDIVERHGGHVWAESQPGKGSTFHVVLPRIQPSERQESLH